jgi:hypothetical protein
MAQANSGIPLGQWSGSDATNKLRETIEAFNTETNRQTETVIRLTKWMLWLTIVMTAAVAVQIFLTLRQMQWL